MIETTGPAASYQVENDGPAGEVVYKTRVTVGRTVKSAKAAIRSAKERLEAADYKFSTELRDAEEAGNYDILDLPDADPRRRQYEQYMIFSQRAGIMAQMLTAFLAVPDSTEISSVHSEPWIQVEKFCRAVEDLAIGAGLTKIDQ